MATTRDLPSLSADDFRLIVDATPALIHTAEPDGTVDFLNQGWLDFVGVPVEDLLGWRWITTFHPDDVESCVSKWRAALASGEAFEGEGRVRRADGEYRLLLHRKVPTRDQNGRVVKWYGLSTDITDRKRAEEELRRSEMELREIVDAIPHAIVVLAPDGKALRTNQYTLEFTGLNADQAQERTFRAIHEDDAARLRGVREQSLARGLPFQLELRARGKDQRYRWFLVHYNPLLDDRGEILRWYATGTDIDDRKRAEDALRESKQRFQLALDTIPGLVWSALPDGFIDYLNRRWLEYTGLCFDDAKGWGWQAAIHPDDLSRLLEIWRGLLGTPQPGTAKARLRHHKGEYRWFLFRAVPLRDDAGKVVKWYGQTTDIDDLQRAEEELRRSEEFRLEERVNERTRIARELHDTLLQSVQGLVLRFEAAHTLLPGDPVKAKHALAVALERADQAIAEGRQAVLGLRASPAQIDSDFARALAALGDDFVVYGEQDEPAAATFRVSMEGTPRLLQPIVRDELYQIAREALRNAFRHATATLVEAHVIYGEPLFRMRIRDDGTGIDPALIERDRRPGHWGLVGMRERAARIGARIAICSDRGHGTDIDVSLEAPRAYVASASSSA